MKYTKNNNVKRNLNKRNIQFDEVRDCMADDGLPVDYRAEEKK